MMGHGAANPLVAAVLLDVSDPLLTLTHDFCPLQVEVFVDHLKHDDSVQPQKIHTVRHDLLSYSAGPDLLNIKALLCIKTASHSC